MVWCLKLGITIKISVAVVDPRLNPARSTLNSNPKLIGVQGACHFYYCLNLHILPLFQFRLWRRTRSFHPEVNTTCFGVDGNRNFNVSWNTIGISPNPCSDVYPGPFPFSEPETGYVRDVLHQYRDRIQVYMDIHSHGNYLLFGYGDRSLPPNAAQIHFVGAVMGAAMDEHKLPQAGFYLVGNSALVLYVSSGSAQDYGQVTLQTFLNQHKNFWFRILP